MGTIPSTQDWVELASLPTRKNVEFQIFQFHPATQLPEEMTDQYVTRLCKLVVSCEFHNVSRKIKSTVIQNCSYKCLRWYALREADVILYTLIAKVRSLEISELQSRGMKKIMASEDVNQVSYKQPTKPVFQNQHVKVHRTHNTCCNYGLMWPHTISLCPTKGQQHYNCRNPNHFAKVCLSKPSVPKESVENTFTTKKDAANHISIAADPNGSSDDKCMYALSLKPYKKFRWSQSKSVVFPLT